MSKPMTYAMIGGGTDAFIGEVHRRAIALDSSATLVAGALSSTPERSVQSAKLLGLTEDRSYGTYQELFERENARQDPVDFVVIVTPNDTHYPIAKAALENGFHVVMDKPSTHTSVQSQELSELASKHNLLCCVTYNYTGYPMVRQAKAMVREGALGSIRKVIIEYHQGWLAADLESTGQKQAAWRVDPSRAGLGGALGDIGTHAENLGSFITGLEMESVYADLNAFVTGRQLDDDASVLIKYKGGAHGIISASQVCIGKGNGLSIRIYGDQGALHWNQEAPDELQFTQIDSNTMTYTRGGPGLNTDAEISSRIPQGHPEGYLEAFANIYRGVVDAIDAKREGSQETRLSQFLPTIKDGAKGVQFVERCVESASKGCSVKY